jgi:diguanylate cyclase (GGDEF)-like protein
VESSRDIVYYFEIKPGFKYRYLSPAIEKILSPNLVKESMENPYTAFERIHPDDYDILMKKVSGEIDYSKPIIQRWKNDEGNYISFEEYATPIYESGEIVAVQGIIRNINEKLILQTKLEYKVNHDTLTDLYNREYFESQIEQYDKYNDVSIAIVICDLDGLKITNDNYGHRTGDELIKETANLLKKFSNSETIIARIGGDEFAIFLINSSPEKVEVFLDNLKCQIRSFNLSNHEFKIRVSIGYAYNDFSLGKMEKLFIQADNNMYFDKNNKKVLLGN